jgi:hypothetical protein
MTQRSGCDGAPDWISLMVSPDELDAMITSLRQQHVELSIETLPENDSLGPVLPHEIDVSDRLRERAREIRVRLRRSGRETQSLTRRPGSLCETSQRRLSIRSNVGRDDFQPLRKEQCRPARSNDPRSDDGNSANWPAIGPVAYPWIVSGAAARTASEPAGEVSKVSARAI